MSGEQKGKSDEKDKEQEKVSIFLTGATGYIGGAIFQQIVPRKHAYKVTVLVRDKEKGDKLMKDYGVEIVMGSLDDSDILAKAAQNADVVIHTAESADHLGSAKAFVQGLEKRAESSKRKPIYIHTSGSAVCCDYDAPVVGVYSDQTFTESKLGDVEGVSPKALHREIDLVVLNAGQRNKIDTIIVSPSMIYGVSNGPFNQHSIQVPLLIKCALKNKQACHLNEGANVWANVHIMDLAELYLTILQKSIEGKALVNRAGYYFASNGENSMREISAKIGEVLHQMDPQTYPQAAVSLPAGSEKAIELFGTIGIAVVGYNSRFIAEKGRHLGWHPHRASLLETIKPEVEYSIEKEKK